MAISERVRAEYRPGDVLAGSFRVEALLGEGGAGAVYRVRDERSGRKLALKQLRPPGGEHRELLTAHFEREYHVLSQLAHPRIIEVYDYGLEQGDPYYTMELLDGEDLHERGKLPWRQACALLCDVASSLAMLHSRGLVHRDVSARNVRCTSDGRAKLIDFGAMAPIGVSQRLVGTPPFVPPEALQLQALDGRADLYGLGALAYWTLTGRHAYPAKTFNQLRDVWRKIAPSPSNYDPAVPPALAELVMALLRLERAERPASAAEVMERLSGIAGLPLQELPQVGRAYLIMPTLVGRASALQSARGVLLPALQAERGGALLIEGAAGVGRSRFLDACVLEAKLMGAIVLRGAAMDGAHGDYGLARTLCAQLYQAMPEACMQSAQPRLSLLSHVLPALGGRAQSGPSAAPERRHLQAALRDWLLAVTRSKHIVIAVDDIAAVDEPSAAWLGALAHGAKRRRLTLLLTARSDAPPSSAMSLLRELASLVQLQPLQPEETAALLRSLFGDSPRLLPLAERIHPLSQGNPRQIMALCEHLVARGSARYEAGSWALPFELSSEDLPASLTMLWAARTAALSPDATELAQVLCLTDPAAWAAGDYVALSAHGSQARVYRALQELLAAGILVPEGSRYHFSHPELASQLEVSLPEWRKRELHARIADAIADTDDPALRPRHLLLGGREREGIEDLRAKRDHPRLVYSSAALSLLEIALHSAERLGVDSELQIDLGIWFVSQTVLLGDYPRFDRYAWPLLERLMRDGGLRDDEQLAHEQPWLDPDDRFALALERAQQRHDALPDRALGCRPQFAHEQLTLLCPVIAGFAAWAMEPSVMARLPSLRPLQAVHPSAAIAQLHIETLSAMLRARYEVVAANVDELLRLLEAPPAGLSAVYAKQLRLSCLYLSGLLLAGGGHPSTRARLKELECEPGYRVLAWRVYTIYELTLGNVEAATECERRADLLNLQDGGQLVFPGGTAEMELVANSIANNIIGVKRAMERLDMLAKRLPAWRPYADVARAHYHRLQGDGAAALSALEPALANVDAGCSPAWASVVRCHLLLLTTWRPAGEAVEQAFRYLEAATEHKLGAARLALQRLAAEALVEAGRAPEAAPIAEAHLQAHLQLGTRGLALGLAHETCARVAIMMGDGPAATRHIELCASQYQTGRNAGLNARCERLMREAALAGIALPGAPQARPVDALDAMQQAARTVYSRMLACISPSERAEQGLQLLLEATGAQTGHFFGLRSGKLRWLSSSEPREPAPGMSSMLEDCLQRELEQEQNRTRHQPGISARAIAPALARFIDPLGRDFEPLLLSGRLQGEVLIAGVAALHYADDERPAPRQAMLDAVIEALIADDVVDPITCVA